MAKTTHVKAAQQRYKMVPVLDGDGNQKTVSVNRMTKRGKEISKRLTVADKSQPLPPHTCDSCGKPIEVGTSYKHISPRSGPYGGRTLYRHEDCPGWHEWEYSSSLNARLAEISFNAFESIGQVDNADDAKQVFDDAAEQIREIAAEKEESADNIEEGFQHATQMSDELRETSEALNQWADDVENAFDDAPEFPEPEEEDCGECNAGETVGEDGETHDCPDCKGTGRVTPEEATEEQIGDWLQEVSDLLSIVDESPV